MSSPPPPPSIEPSLPPSESPSPRPPSATIFAVATVGATVAFVSIANRRRLPRRSGMLLLPLLLRARARSYVPARNPSLGQTANSTAVHNRIMFYIFSDPARARHFT